MIAPTTLDRDLEVWSYGSEGPGGGVQHDQIRSIILLINNEPSLLEGSG
jgi:hypothetical protein